MIAALFATMVVLGFGAVTLRLVQADLRQADQRLARDEAALHAEYAASQAVSRVVDGQEASFRTSGTVDGDDYSYSIVDNGDETWTIVGRSGSGSGERTATVSLRRVTTTTGSTPPTSTERYAVYAYDEIDIGYVGSGDVDGPVGSGGDIDFRRRQSIGTRQDHVDRCNNCPNPQLNTTYVPIELPTPQNLQPCPGFGYIISGRVTLNGEYDCTASRRLLITATIEVSGPTIIHLGDGTGLTISGASINDGGDSADFVIAKPTTSSSSWNVTITSMTMHGRILAPENRISIRDAKWRGTFEVGTWRLYNYGDIDGAWDGGTETGDGGGQTSVGWVVDSWQLD